NRRTLPSKLEDVHGLGNSLPVHASSIDVPDPLQPAGQMDDAVGDDHFTRVSEPAEACSDVECRSPETAVDPDRLARVDPDADVEGQVGVGSALVLEARLEFDGRSKALAGGREDGERFVSPPL